MDSVDSLGCARCCRSRRRWLSNGEVHRVDQAPDYFERDEARLVEFCVELPWWATVKAVRYWADRVDTLTGDDDGPPPRWRNRQATSHRGIGDELHVEAIFDAVGGATFAAAWERIDNELRLADEANPDALPRTPAQRRLDALVEMAVRATANTNNGGGGRPRPLVTVAVGDHSFRRLCELSDGTVICPGELVPYVGDLDVNAILFNGPFHAIGGSPTRTFGGLLRRAIEVRDRVCQHPPQTATRSTAATSTTSSPPRSAGPPANTTGNCWKPGATATPTAATSPPPTSPSGTTTRSPSPPANASKHSSTNTPTTQPQLNAGDATASAACERYGRGAAVRPPELVGVRRRRTNPTSARWCSRSIWNPTSRSVVE